MKCERSMRIRTFEGVNVQGCLHVPKMGVVSPTSTTMTSELSSLTVEMRARLYMSYLRMRVRDAFAVTGTRYVTDHTLRDIPPCHT